MSIVKKNFKYLVIIKGIFILDVVSKFAIVFFMHIGQSVNYFPFLDIVYFLNTGVSFGILGDIEYGKWIITGITTVILIFLIIALIKEESGFSKFCYALIVGGALGNIVDRIFRGGVVDFLYFHISNYYYPAFNVADSAICVGVFMIIFSSFIVNHLQRLDEKIAEYKRKKNKR